MISNYVIGKKNQKGSREKTQLLVYRKNIKRKYEHI